MPSPESEKSATTSGSLSRKNHQNVVEDGDEDESKGLVAGTSEAGISPMGIEGPEGELPRSRRREDVGSIARRIYIWWVTAPCSLKIKVVVSILLVVVVNIPLYMSRQNSTDIEVVWDPYDLAGCDLLKYNETFDDFEVRIQAIDEAELFCEKSLTIIDHQTCKCDNPTVPVMVDFDRWHEAFEESKKIADKASKLDPLQLVMIGDSITEQWNGLSVGHPIAKYEGNAAVFQELFQVENGGKINAAALGISGDRAANLLYRIENGGMEDLYPDIWWILIGTNDLSGDLCSKDAIVAANIAVVKKMRELRPNATIVINSILPRPSYLWEHLEAINERLQCYAALTEKVDYFNATGFFRFPNGTLKHLPDNLHPDAKGSRIWGEAIVDKVLEILEKR